jgi:hypothetical protein
MILLSPIQHMTLRAMKRMQCQIRGEISNLDNKMTVIRTKHRRNLENNFLLIENRGMI